MTPEFRVGGTDLMERRRRGISTGAIVDIGHTGYKAALLVGTIRETLLRTLA
jgi:hypothetical protein